MYTRTHAFIWVLLCVYMYVHVYIYICIYMYMYTHIYVYIYVSIYNHVYTYIFFLYIYVFVCVCVTYPLHLGLCLSHTHQHTPVGVAPISRWVLFWSSFLTIPKHNFSGCPYESSQMFTFTHIHIYAYSRRYLYTLKWAVTTQTTRTRAVRPISLNTGVEEWCLPRINKKRINQKPSASHTWTRTCGTAVLATHQQQSL